MPPQKSSGGTAAGGASPARLNCAEISRNLFHEQRESINDRDPSESNISEEASREQFPAFCDICDLEENLCLNNT